MRDQWSKMLHKGDDCQQFSSGDTVTPLKMRQGVVAIGNDTLKAILLLLGEHITNPYVTPWHHAVCMQGKGMAV